MFTNNYKFANKVFKISSVYPYFVEFAKEYIVNEKEEFLFY